MIRFLFSAASKTIRHHQETYWVFVHVWMGSQPSKQTVTPAGNQVVSQHGPGVVIIEKCKSGKTSRASSFSLHFSEKGEKTNSHYNQDNVEHLKTIPLISENDVNGIKSELDLKGGNSGEKNVIKDENSLNNSGSRKTEEGQSIKQTLTSNEKINPTHGVDNQTKSEKSRKMEEADLQNREVEKLGDDSTKEKEKPKELTAERIEEIKQETYKKLRKALGVVSNMNAYIGEDGRFVQALKVAAFEIQKYNFALKNASLSEFKKSKKEMGLIWAENGGVESVIDVVLYCMKKGIYDEDSKLIPAIWNPLINLTIALLNFSDMNPELTHHMANHPHYLEAITDYLLAQREAFLAGELRVSYSCCPAQYIHRGKN